MKTIIVKFIAPTRVKGSRLKATDSGGKSVYIDNPHDIGPIEARHFEAVKALCRRNDWAGEVVCGWNRKTGVSYWVFLDFTGGNRYLLPA